MFASGLITLALAAIAVASSAVTRITVTPSTTKATTSSKTTTTTTTSKSTTTTTPTKTTTTTTTSTTTTPISIPTVSPPPQFNITSLGVNGSGCPPGSTFYLLNNDHTAVTITFSQYAAEAGPGIAISENRKNCQATLNVHVPQGFSFAVVNVDYRGFYQLDSKVKALHDAIYYFQGQVVQNEATSTLVGPIDGGDYVYRDTFNLTPTIYSPCGQDTVLNINSQVRVDNSANTAGFGYVTDDSIDASITQTLNFQWLTC